MDEPGTRPTTRVSPVILDSMDRMVGQLTLRLVRLTQAEYLWEPASDMWSVRKADAPGSGVVDGAGIREIDPAPMTTIAWRLWHRGPFEFHCVADIAMHASNELVHHGAEIALLRDLYANTEASAAG